MQGRVLKHHLYMWTISRLLSAHHYH